MTVTSKTVANAPKHEGRYDYGERKKAQRRGRQRGCSVYISAEELAKAGFDPQGEVPYYRVWADARGRGGVRIRLYKEG